MYQTQLNTQFGRLLLILLINCDFFLPWFPHAAVLLKLFQEF